MRVRIEVEDLTAGQRDWLIKNWPARDQGIGPDAARLCVQIETSPGVFQHGEMAPRAFIGLLAQLQLIGRTAEAILTPDSHFIMVDGEAAYAAGWCATLDLNDGEAAYAAGWCATLDLNDAEKS